MTSPAFVHPDAAAAAFLVLPASRRRIRRANSLSTDLVLVEDEGRASWALPSGTVPVAPGFLESARAVASVVVARGRGVTYAWAWGAPVVTDAESLAAAGGTPGTHALVAETAAERLEIARELAADEAHAAALALAGHRLAAGRSTPEVADLAEVVDGLGAPAGAAITGRLAGLAQPLEWSRRGVATPPGEQPFEALPQAVSSFTLATAKFPTAAQEAAPMSQPNESRGSGAGAIRARLGSAKARVRGGVARRVRDAVVVPAVAAAPDRLDGVEGELARVSAELERLRGQVGATTKIADANQINLELLKGEVRDGQAQLSELGFAFAPGAGLVGAGARFSELREAVNGLERQLRNLANQPASATSADGVEVPVAPKPESTLFNYVGFERRFRGDPDEILATLEDRYADLLSEHQPVVDVGCGRGELLDRLAARGAEVIGVEPDPGMVADARARGLTVHQAFAGDFLRSVPDHSLGSIISTHVVEHLELDVLIEFLELARQKLKPGGIFVAETPNPSSLIVLGNSYIMDPTHVWPLHPSLLAFLAESAGYRDIRLGFYSPAEGYHLAPVEVPEDASDAEKAIAAGVTTSFEQLNHVLFGPQDYSIIATTPPE